MTDKQPEALIRAEELEQIGAESSLARAMAAHTIRLLYKENEALRARLAQPEPEPEKSQDKPCVEDDGCPTEKAVLQRFWREHQAQPEREWVGLTDEEYEATAEHYVTNCYFDTLKYARAIEVKLKEKNI